MKNYKFEIILGAVFALMFAAFYQWQSGEAMTQQEVDAYVDKLERTFPKEFAGRDEFIARMRAWGEADDGEPVYMLNVMRYFDKLRNVEGGPVGMTPEESNNYYEEQVMPMLFAKGGYPLMAGTSTGIGSMPANESNLIVFEPELNDWDRIIVVRYPERRAFFDLVTDDQYLKVVDYKMASLEVLLLPTKLEVQFPDMNNAVFIGLLLIWLAIAWRREVTRRKATGA